MKLLLDTQIVLWSLDKSLARRVARLAVALSNPTAQLFVSVASIWEVALKVRTGKLTIDTPLTELDGVLSAQGTTILPIKTDHVVEEVAPGMPTRDPFDRLLVAVAQVEGLRLVTVDSVLVQHPISYRLTN